LPEHFNINQAYLSALQPFLSVRSTDLTFIASLFDWIEQTDIPDTHTLLDLTQEVNRVLYLFQEKLNLSVESVRFIASRPDLFVMTLPFDLQWDSLRSLSIYKKFITVAPNETAKFHQALSDWTGQEFPEQSWPTLAILLKSDTAKIHSLECTATQAIR
jgi:hypothetical protein